MHTGFPEKTLERYATKLVDLGYKVVVVEQVETAKKMQERAKSKVGDKCVHREAV